GVAGRIQEGEGRPERCGLRRTQNLHACVHQFVVQALRARTVHPQCDAFAMALPVLQIHPRQGSAEGERYRCRLEDDGARRRLGGALQSEVGLVEGSNGFNLWCLQGNEVRPGCCAHVNSCWWWRCLVVLPCGGVVYVALLPPRAMSEG